MSASTLPAYTVEATLSPLPTIKTMRSPVDLFESTPFEIVMRLTFTAGSDASGPTAVAQIDGHQPTVRLIREYINTHCRGKIKTTFNDTICHGIQQLQVEEQKDHRTTRLSPLSPLSTLLVGALVEKELGFESIVTPNGENGVWMWVWRRNIAFA